jgi:hypothetical protein
MTEQADQGTVERLANVVDEFREYYDRLTSVKFGAAVAHSKNVQLYRDYGEELARAETLKRRIEYVTGAWASIKEWAGLAALPLIPIAIAVGLIATVTAGVVSIRAFLRRADITLAIQQDPTLTYEQAADQVDTAHQGAFGDALDLARMGMYLVGAFLIYRVITELKP